MMEHRDNLPHFIQVWAFTPSVLSWSCSILSTTYCSTGNGSFKSVAKWSFQLARSLCFSVINFFVVGGEQLFWVVHFWPLHSSQASLKTCGVIIFCKCLEFSHFCQPLVIFEFSASLSEKLKACFISDLSVPAEHVIPGSVSVVNKPF